RWRLRPQPRTIPDAPLRGRGTLPEVRAQGAGVRLPVVGPPGASGDEGGRGAAGDALRRRRSRRELSSTFALWFPTGRTVARTLAEYHRASVSFRLWKSQHITDRLTPCPSSLPKTTSPSALTCANCSNANSPPTSRSSKPPTARAS